MKLTYEMLRRLSEIDDGGKLIIKNRSGHVLKSALKKWDQSPKETRSTSTMVPQRPSHALMENHSQTSPLRFSSQPLQRPGKR